MHTLKLMIRLDVRIAPSWQRFKINLPFASIDRSRSLRDKPRSLQTAKRKFLQIHKSRNLIPKMKFNQIASSYICSISRILLVAIFLTIAFTEPALARVSKKFLKGFLLGAYMAKHHEPIVIHMEKSKHG